MEKRTKKKTFLWNENDCQFCRSNLFLLLRKFILKKSKPKWDFYELKCKCSMLTKTPCNFFDWKIGKERQSSGWASEERERERMKLIEKVSECMCTYKKVCSGIGIYLYRRSNDKEIQSNNFSPLNKFVFSYVFILFRFFFFCLIVW